MKGQGTGPRSLSRREFLTGMAGAGATLALANRARSLTLLERPNFLFIITDDQRADAMSCVGHPLLFTPNLDRLAKEGALFSNAFTTTALCSPSRASFLTGLYAHGHGVRDNQTHLKPEVPTFAQMLQDRGYATAFIGKWHMDMQRGPQPGFDHWISFAGQGEYFHPTLNFNGEERKVAGYITDLLTRYAIEWLEGPTIRPFCLCLSHKAVHADFQPAVRHSRLFENDDVTLPKSFDDTLEGKPEWLSNVKRFTENTESLAELRGKMLDYFRTLMSVDESVGRILKALEERGELDSTVVIFAGDNGYMFGEHGLGDKRAMYEESIRIPLIVRHPTFVQPGVRPVEMALNIDICPTILDLAHVKPSRPLDGLSLRPLLEGKSPSWREDFLYEYFWEAEARKRPAIDGVRTARWKYITYPDSDYRSELYDLAADPLEMHNLAESTRHQAVLEELKARLADHLARRPRNDRQA